MHGGQFPDVSLLYRHMFATFTCKTHFVPVGWILMRFLDGTFARHSGETKCYRLPPCACIFRETLIHSSPAITHCSIAWLFLDLPSISAKPQTRYDWRNVSDCNWPLCFRLKRRSPVRSVVFDTLGIKFISTASFFTPVQMVTPSWKPGSVVWASLSELHWWPAIVLNPDEVSNEIHTLTALPPGKCMVRLINHPGPPTEVFAQDLLSFCSDEFTERQLSNEDQHSSRISIAVQMALNLIGAARLNMPTPTPMSHQLPRLTLSQPSSSFVVGTVLWINFSGYPWWPGRIIDKSDCNFSSLRTERILPHQVLVKFFNDNDRFCIVEKTKTAPFRKDEFYETRLRYRGRHAPSVTLAVEQAWAFIEAESGMLMVPKKGSPAPKRTRTTGASRQSYKRRRSLPLRIGIPTNAATASVLCNRTTISDHDISEIENTDSAPKESQVTNRLQPDKNMLRRDLPDKHASSAPSPPPQASLRERDPPPPEERCSSRSEEQDSAAQTSKTVSTGLTNMEDKNAHANQAPESRPLRKRSEWASPVSRAKAVLIPTVSCTGGSGNSKGSSERNRIASDHLRGGKEPVKANFIGRSTSFINGGQESAEKSSSLTPNSKALTGKPGSSVTSSSVDQEGLKELRSPAAPVRSGEVGCPANSVKSIRGSAEDPQSAGKLCINVPAVIPASVSGCQAGDQLSVGKQRMNGDAPDANDLCKDSELDPIPPHAERDTTANGRLCGACAPSREHKGGSKGAAKSPVVEREIQDAYPGLRTKGSRILKKSRPKPRGINQENRVGVTVSEQHLPAENCDRTAEGLNSNSNFADPENAEADIIASVEQSPRQISAAHAGANRRSPARPDRVEGRNAKESRIDNNFENIPIGNSQAHREALGEGGGRSELQKNDLNGSGTGSSKVGAVSNSLNGRPTIGKKTINNSRGSSNECRTCKCSNRTNSRTKHSRKKRQKTLSKAFELLANAVQMIQSVVVEDDHSDTDEDEVD